MRQPPKESPRSYSFSGRTPLPGVGRVSIRRIQRDHGYHPYALRRREPNRSQFLVSLASATPSVAGKARIRVISTQEVVPRKR
jgi:hypothetical protein